jgi:membrane protein DedA with SNARE-associated domain
MTELLGNGSYLAIIVVLILTGAGLPIPEEVPIITAGILASHDALDPWLAAGACLIGALLGDCVMYWIGYHFGRTVLREHHRWAHFMHAEREARIEQMIQRHGLKVLFLARFLVGLRSPVYLSAGVLRMPFRRFFLMDLICATAVIGLFFSLSYYYGTTITRAIQGVEYLLTAIVIVALLGVSLFLWRRHRRKLAAAQPEATEDEASKFDPRGEPVSEIEHVA